MNYEKKHIRTLKLENGQILTKQNDILNEEKRFYSELYSTKLTEPVNTANIFFENDNIKCIPESDKEFCDSPLTEVECRTALDQFENNKTPGNDGLTAEFYKFFWEDIKDILMNSFYKAQVEGCLSPSQRQAVITLIDKKDKDRAILKNWRPISLLNVDYKILSKALSMRLIKNLPNIIQ